MVMPLAVLCMYLVDGHPHQSFMEPKAEIIDFFQPLENVKNLFVSNIITKSTNEEESINCALHLAFSRFGLVYEIQVLQTKLKTQVPGNQSFRFSESNISVVNADCHPKIMGDFKGNPSDPESKVVNDSSGPCLWYAFVKFYSSRSALEAKRALHLTAIVGLENCKVNFAKRKKTIGPKFELQARQCHDLANFYLGFHGWSSCVQILKGEIIKPVVPEDSYRYRQLCVVDLFIPAHGLQTTGLGLFEDTYKPQDRYTVGNVFARCKKRAYQEALQKAFSTVLLVVLSSGKVCPEINTSRQELLMRDISAEILNFPTGNEQADRLADAIPLGRELIQDKMDKELPSGRTLSAGGCRKVLLSSCFVVQAECAMWNRKSKE